MGSPVSKNVSADVAAAIAAFEAKKEVTKVATSVAQNLRKTKYVGKKSLAGVSSRFNCAAYSL